MWFDPWPDWEVKDYPITQQIGKTNDQIDWMIAGVEDKTANMKLLKMSQRTNT